MSVQDIGLNHEGKLKRKTPVELSLVWTACPVLRCKTYICTPSGWNLRYAIFNCTKSAARDGWVKLNSITIFVRVPVMTGPHFSPYHLDKWSLSSHPT